VEECARALEKVLDDPPAARAMALRGKEYVRRNFLSPRLLRDWLALFNRLDGNDLPGAELVTASTAA
jgi:trehalose synthase